MTIRVVSMSVSNFAREVLHDPRVAELQALQTPAALCGAARLTETRPLGFILLDESAVLVATYDKSFQMHLEITPDPFDATWEGMQSASVAEHTATDLFVHSDGRPAGVALVGKRECVEAFYRREMDERLRNCIVAVVFAEQQGRDGMYEGLIKIVSTRV